MKRIWRLMLNIRSKRDGKVYCMRCENLLLTKGKDKVLPLCVALCKFTGNTVMDRTDLLGIDYPESLNKRNTCAFFVKKTLLSVFHRSFVYKRIVLDVLGVSQAKLSDIDTCSISTGRLHGRKKS
jgi:hypothetical protein